MGAKIDVTDVKNIVAEIRTHEKTRPEDVLSALRACLMVIRDRAQTVHLVHGNPLHRRTGDLQRSITVSTPVRSGHSYSGSVGTDVRAAGKNVSYGYWHEFGHGPIKPRKKKFMFFQLYEGDITGPHGEATGDFVMTAETKGIPKRPWLMPSVEESMGDCQVILEHIGAKIIKGG